MRRVANTSLVPEADLLDEQLETIKADVPVAHLNELRELDECLGGIYPGLLTIIAARPASGKTTLLGQMADDLAAQGLPCILLTDELPAHKNLVKSITRLGGGSFALADVPRHDEDSALGTAISKAIESYRTSIAPNMYYIERFEGEAAFTRLVSECCQKHGQAPAVFIDYLQLIASRKAVPGIEERSAINGCVQFLEDLAKEFGSPVFVLSSISRTSYGKQYAGPDVFSGSQGIEYGVDNALFMAVDGEGPKERQKNAERAVRPVTLTAIKIRYGTQRTVLLDFDAEHAMFRSRC